MRTSDHRTNLHDRQLNDGNVTAAASSSICASSASTESKRFCPRTNRKSRSASSSPYIEPVKVEQPGLDRARGPVERRIRPDRDEPGIVAAVVPPGDRVHAVGRQHLLRRDARRWRSGNPRSCPRPAPNPTTPRTTYGIAEQPVGERADRRRAIAARTRVLDTRSPSTIAFGTPIASRPCAAKCACANATSPTRLRTEAEVRPDDHRRARRAPATSTSSRNACRRERRERLDRSVSTNISSTPARANALTRSPASRSAAAPHPGRKNAIGCSPNVSTAVRSAGTPRLQQRPHDRLMAEVKPVEHADRDAQRMPRALGAIRRRPAAAHSAASQEHLARREQRAHRLADADQHARRIAHEHVLVGRAARRAARAGRRENPSPAARRARRSESE